MRKILFVAALAAMLVLAIGGSAFAAGINHSGQTQFGAQGTASLIPTAVSDANIYYPWITSPTAGAGTNGVIAGDNSPHGNYTTTTVKCVVCHAVHYSAAGGAPVGSGQTADTLLRMKASDACVYCHATSGMSVNGRPVYDGLGAAILAPGATGGNTTTGHITGTNCSYCHTNVHGAGADHTVAALDGYLLKLMTATDVQGTGATTNNMIEAITAIDNNAVNQLFLPAGSALNGTIGDYATVSNTTLREQAVGIFCAECHNGSYAQAAAGASANVQNASTFAAYSGHRIAANATSNWNATGDMSSGLYSGTIAWKTASNCKSCHDANDTFGNTAFPHSWGGTKMWLTSAANAGAATSNLPYGGGVNAWNVNRPQLSDGVCLKCHVSSGNTSGVGITF